MELLCSTVNIHISVDSDEEKLDNAYRKMATLFIKKEEPLQAADALRRLISQLSDGRKKKEAWGSITEILLGIKDLSPEHTLQVQ